VGWKSKGPASGCDHQHRYFFPGLEGVKEGYYHSVKFAIANVLNQPKCFRWERIYGKDFEIARTPHGGLGYSRSGLKGLSEDSNLDGTEPHWRLDKTRGTTAINAYLNRQV
jgi:hypothetical protein